MKARLCRFLCILLLVTLPFSAFAEIKCVCKEDPCICFIQEGDASPVIAGALRLLEEKGYITLDKVQQSAVSCLLNEKAAAAVRAFQRDQALPETGQLDDETLTRLIFGLSPAELSNAKPDLSAAAVWIPVKGGTEYHLDPACCAMIHPRLITQRNAEALKIDKCGLCSAPQNNH